MQWFREYTKLLHDPVVQRLEPPLFKTWFNLRCLAGSNSPRGFLPLLGDIAFALRQEEQLTADQLAALEAAGLLDWWERPDSGELTLHVAGWETEQFESDDVAARVKRHRHVARPPPPSTIDVTLHSEHVTPLSNVIEQNRSRTDTETEQSAVRAREAVPTARSKYPTTTPTPAPTQAEFKLNAQDTVWWETQIAAFAHAPAYWHKRSFLSSQRDLFLDHSARAGRVSRDWNAEWRTWLRREITYYLRDSEGDAHAMPQKANGRSPRARPGAAAPPALDPHKYLHGPYAHLFNRKETDQQ